MSIDRLIWVTWQREGIHRYPAAETDPRLVDVKFLSNPHRHIFHFKVMIEVSHNDRDIEFILLKRELEGLYDNQTLQLDFKSCEMLAEDLVDYINQKYPGRDAIVTVSEDGENGATLSYLAD